MKLIPVPETQTKSILTNTISSNIIRDDLYVTILEDIEYAILNSITEDDGTIIYTTLIQSVLNRAANEIRQTC